jgi:hypothetical protein
MADKKISQLTTLAQADVAVTADFLPIVDTSATETKKATPQSVVLGALGATSANVGIGTASPTYRLDLQSSTAALGLRLKGGSGTNQGSVLLGTYAGSSSTFYGFGDRAALFGGTPDQLVSIFTGSTALTFDINGGEKARIDSSGNVGIGTSSPGARLDVDGGAQDEMARINSTGNTSFAVYRSGIRQVYLQSDASNINLWGEANKPMRFATNNIERARITANGSFVAGAQAALATTATDGFLYVPTCAGTPTGTPTAITGMAPIVVNTTNNKLYFYSGGAWRDAGP